jgi:hypothetical protein
MNSHHVLAGLRKLVHRFVVVRQPLGALKNVGSYFNVIISKESTNSNSSIGATPNATQVLALRALN